MRRSVVRDVLKSRLAGFIELDCVTEARLRVGNPWPEGIRVASTFWGDAPGGGSNPKFTYEGLIYQVKADWFLTLEVRSRSDRYSHLGTEVSPSEVIPWLYKPPELNVIRSIPLRSLVSIVLDGMRYAVEDD